MTASRERTIFVRRVWSHAWPLALLVLLAAAARPTVDLGAGDTPPTFTLPNLNGATVALEDLEGRPVVVMFGEIYHPRTQEACEDVRRALRDPRLTGEEIRRVLIVAQDTAVDDLARMAEDAGMTATVLHDVRRTVFGAYRVRVMPTAVVLGADGRVVHALTGHSPLFRDIVTDAMLVAVGRLSREEFERGLRAEAGAEMSEELKRAGRVTKLAHQLARRGLLDLADENYGEALQVAPDYVPALLGRGTLELRRGRLENAESAFRSVLAIDAASTDGVLGIAYVQTMRGGDELAEADRHLREVIARTPLEPRAHFMLGLIHDQRGESEAASASFRRAAELLMSERPTWQVIPREIEP